MRNIVPSQAHASKIAKIEFVFHAELVYMQDNHAHNLLKRSSDVVLPTLQEHDGDPGAHACVGGKPISALAQQQLQHLVLVELVQDDVLLKAHLAQPCIPLVQSRPFREGDQHILASPVTMSAATSAPFPYSLGPIVHVHLLCPLH